MLKSLATLDRTLYLILNSLWTSPFLDRLMPIVTNQEIGILFLLAIFALTAVFARREGRIAVAGAVASYAIIDPFGHYVLKEIIARPRPCHLELGRLLVDCGGGYAMPSLHAAASMGVFLSLVLRLGPKWSPLILLSLLVGYSRIYVGVHWPADFLAGICYGAAVAVGIYFLGRRIFPPRERGGEDD